MVNILSSFKYWI